MGKMIAYFFTKPLDFDYQLLYSNRIGAQVLNLFLFYQKKGTMSLFPDSGITVVLPHNILLDSAIIVKDIFFIICSL